MISDEVTDFEEALAGAAAQLQSVLVSSTFKGFAGVSDVDLAGLISRVEAVGRLVDAMRVHAAYQVHERTSSVSNADPEFSMAHAYGFKNARAFVQNMTGVPGVEATSRIRLGAAVATRFSASGEELPSEWEHVATAVNRGLIDKSAASLIVSGLNRLGSHVDPEQIRFAEQQLVEQAVWGRVGADAGADGGADAGADADSGVDSGADFGGMGEFPEHADNIHVITSAWCAALDQEGTPPVEEQMAKRFFTIGKERAGLVPIRGAVLPEVAAKIGRFFDAHLNPRVRFTGESGGLRFTEEREDLRVGDGEQGGGELGGVEFVDTRSSNEKRHDAFATAMNFALKSSDNPNLGGEAVSLVIQVTEENLHKEHGVAWIEDAHGTHTPIHSSIARHASCVGSVQRVTQDRNGKIVSLETNARIFNSHQRKAIMLRDGGCVIPGCDTPTTWCEIHHVQEHSKGGPTHTDNGVTLCWFHHRHIETHEWGIRMRDGVVETKAPRWLDPQRRWRRRQAPHLMTSMQRASA